MTQRFSDYADENGLSVTTTNPTVGGDASSRRAFNLDVTTDSSTGTPAFTNQSGETITVTAIHGDNVYGGGTNAKTTFAASSLNVLARAAGQRFVQTQIMNAYGMGDAFIGARRLAFAGGNIAGDEGQGFYPQDLLTQLSVLSLATIETVTATTYDSTATQAIVASKDVQTITVASTTNAVVGDWIVVGQALPTLLANMEAVQITAVGVGTISGIFRTNQNSGVTLTPAKVLILSAGNYVGQGRVLINLSGASYSTGTVASISGGGFTGSGTTWATNMVGGNATNIGAIALTADDYNGAPFNGGGDNGLLKSWYQIGEFASTTSIGVYKTSTAGDAAYRGKGVGAGGYIVRPCARILWTDGSRQVVLENTTATWSVGHSVEMALTPYPDVSAESLQFSVWTPGGTLRALKTLNNVGARAFECGLYLTSALKTGSNADTIAYTTGIEINAPVSTGLLIRNAAENAIVLQSYEGSSGLSTDNAGKIFWLNTASYIKPNSTNKGIDWYMTLTGSDGLLQTKNATVIGSGSRSSLSFNGIMGPTTTTYAALPTAATALNGMMAYVSDLTSSLAGSTAAGGGAIHGLVVCKAAVWTVVGTTRNTTDEFYLNPAGAGTDVSAEFSALVTAALAVGGTIYVPRGEFTISPVTVGAAGSYKSIRIVGELWEGHFGDSTDYGSVLKLKNGSNATMFTVAASDASDVGPSPFVLENLRIKGNRSNQTGTSYCVDFSNHTASANKQRSGHFRRCFIDDFRSGGIRIGTLRNAGVMEQVTILNIGNGSSGSCVILGSASDWRFSKCDFGVALGPTIHSSGGSNVMYVDCNIFSAGTHGYKADTASGDHKFVNTSFDRNTQYGVHIDHTTPYHWNFTNCRFTQNSLGTTNTHSDLYINNNPNVSLANCSFMSWSGSERPKYAIEFAGTGAAQMVGCTFDDDAFGTAVSNSPSINTQTDSYTLVRADTGKTVEMNKATAVNLTVPLNSSVAYPLDTKITVTQIGNGQVTFVPTGGVTILSYNSDLKLAGQYAAATLYKRGTNEWMLIGNLTT